MGEFLEDFPLSAVFLIFATLLFVAAFSAEFRPFFTLVTVLLMLVAGMAFMM